MYNFRCVKEMTSEELNMLCELSKEIHLARKTMMYNTKTIFQITFKNSCPENIN